MAGLIVREDVDAVRDRSRLEDIVGQHVTLRNAGVGALKGLCPFHDEKTPSFHVRPQLGRWHCFGCNEGGDAISFVQKLDGLSFTEAVEYLATGLGIQLRYEDGDGPTQRVDVGLRQRILDANRNAAKYFVEMLRSANGKPAQDFLTERGFDAAAVASFGIGFAPLGWHGLVTYLNKLGFKNEELLAAGLVSQSERGLYDRFRGRVIWPIKDVTGEYIGFGARKLFEDDNGPKYLNTPETAVYKKSQVLYGLDAAKKEIARNKQIVIVEGYTDVMAAHLAGIKTAVATCGTAFGHDHVRIARRMLGQGGSNDGVMLADGKSLGGEVIFTFDGDAAGKKAALKAFSEDQNFSAQTYVAISPQNMDPCELWQKHGPQALQDLISSRRPLFEFVLRTILNEFDLNTVEGRINALQRSAQVVYGIKDTTLRSEYVRVLAGWLGLEVAVVQSEVRKSQSQGAARRNRGPIGEQLPPGASQAVSSQRRGGANNVGRGFVQLQELVLQGSLQAPDKVLQDVFDSISSEVFSDPAFRRVHELMIEVGGVKVGAGAQKKWLADIYDLADEQIKPVIDALTLKALPHDNTETLGAFLQGVLLSFLEKCIGREIQQRKGALQRLDQALDADAYHLAFTELIELEAQRRELLNLL